MKKTIFILITLMFALSLTSCKDNGPDEPDDIPQTIEVKPEVDYLEFALGEAKDINFDVLTNGAVNTPEITVPQGWNYKISNFTKDGDKGYKGVVKITAPADPSEGEIVINVSNGEDVSDSASIEVEATMEPLVVEIGITGDVQMLETSESKMVLFTVERNVPVTLTAHVEATNGWEVSIDGFAADDVNDPARNYEGAILIQAPDTRSETEITLSIKNEAGNVVKSAKLNAQCSKTFDIKLDAPNNMSFAFSETADVKFTVRGKDAKNLIPSVDASSGGWSASLKSFDAVTDGYDGVISVTAPATQSTGTVTINVSDDDEINISHEISVFSAAISMTFGKDRYVVDKAHGVVNVEYTLNGIGDMTFTSQLIFPFGWRLDNSSGSSGHKFERDDENRRYTGSFPMFAENFPEDNVMYVRIKNTESGQAIDFPLDIRLGDGNTVPAPKTAANCIVVDRSGAVAFDAKKGDGAPVTGTQVKWIWADKDGLIDDTSLKFEDNQIKFNTAAVFKPGNILIALFDASDKIVWSWHVWFVSGLNMNASSGEFMNMNLGATASTRQSGNTDDFGLMYQWGRKEPIVGVKDRSGGREEASTAFKEFTQEYVIATGYEWKAANVKMETHEIAAQNPTTLPILSSSLPSAGKGPWGTISDPCPMGWRVPNQMELREHWDLYNDAIQHSGYSDGLMPNSYPDEWWPSASSRMTYNGMSNYMGAVRQSGPFYWSNTSTIYYMEYDPDEDLDDKGYQSALALGDRYNRYLHTKSWSKQHTASVRCIKE